MPGWDPRIARAILHAERNLESAGAALSVDALAREAGMSPFHFHRLFRATLGEPVSAWVRRLRLERAAMLLRHTGKPLVEIAMLCGYATQAAFTRAFARHFRAAPGAWRAAHGLALWRGGRAAAPAPSVELHPALRVLWRRHQGDWSGIAEAMREVCVIFEERGWYRSDTALVLFLYDEPDVTPLARQRVDLGLTLPADAGATGWDVREVEEGPAAYVDVDGDYATFEAAAIDFAYVQLPRLGRETRGEHLLALGPGRQAWALADDLAGALARTCPIRILQPLARG